MNSPHKLLSVQPVANPGQLQFTGKLYGRDQAIGSLLAAFEHICRGSGVVQLVPGHSGVGKTALVQEVRKPVISRNGFFLDGKFNQYQQGVPYFAIRQALAKLCRELKRDDDLQRQHWSTGLLQAVGNQGQLLVDLVPELESIIGKQAPVADISPTEARHRFAGVIREFFKVVCRPEHPLVLFIDDWQWADAASLDLLTRLRVDTELRYLLVIVAYRDDEIDPAHPLVAALEELRRQAVPVEVIEVHNLALDDIGALLADALKPEVESLDGLAALVHRHTEGNPFFTRMFVEFLYDHGLLKFEPIRSCWFWSLDENNESKLPLDVVSLFARKIGQLETASRKLLSRAACLGNRFDLETLAIISDYSAAQCRTMLEPGLAHGLILPVEGDPAPENFFFLHDRVQQAAYCFIQPSELAEARLEIGRRLLAHLSPKQLEERLFQVVVHMNAGHALVHDPDEQVRIVTLNVRAALKARAATAYRTALLFQRAAARFLELPGFAERLWENHHGLAMQLFLAWSEGEFLEGDRNESERCIRQAVAHVASSLERAEALNALIVQFTLLARYPDAIAAGREALAALGVTLPEGGYEAARDVEIGQVRQQLKGRPVAELFHLPVMSNPEMRMVTKLLITMGPPCYRSHQRLWSVIVPKVVNLTIRYGNIPQIGYSHTAFGGLLGWVANDYATAKEFGDLATRLMASTFDSPSDQSIFYLMIGSSLRHWFDHLKSGSRDYAMAYETGLRSGNLQYAAYAFGHNMYCRFYQGAPLLELMQESQRSLDFSRTRVNQWAIDLLEGGLRIFGSLSGFTPSIDDNETWEADYLRQVDEHHNIQVRCIYQELRAFSLLLLGQYERALMWSDKVEPLIYTVGTQGLLPWPEHVFARLLIIAALYPDATPGRQAIWRSDLAKMLEQLGVWAGSCPENFAHKHALAAGEVARLEGRVFAAMRLYHEAAESAAIGGFLQWEGLANERAAALLEACGKSQLAIFYRQQAYACYYCWGATRKLQAMEDTCRDQFSSDILGMAKSGVAEDMPDQKLLSGILEKQLNQLRLQSADIVYASRQNESERISRELAEASDRLRVEIAERKRAEEQLQQHQKTLAEKIKQRTADLEDSQNQLIDARTAALNLMEDAIAARDRSEVRRIALEREIAEHKQTEEKLRASEQKFMRLFMEIPVPLGVANKEGVISHFNNKFTEVFGYTTADVPTLNEWWIHAYPNEAYRRWVLSNWSDAVAKAAKEGTNVESAEYNVICKNGAERIVIIGGSPVEGGVLAIFNDITDRKRSEEKLAAAHKELESIIEAQPDILYVINTKGELIKWNSALEKLCGLSPEIMLKKPAIEFVCEEDRPTVHNGIREVFEKGSAFIEVRFIRGDGSLVPHLCSGAVWKSPGGEVLGFIGVGRDMTERKKLDEELELFRLMVEKSGDPIFMIDDDDGCRLIYVNEAAIKHYGAAREELLTWHIPDWDPNFSYEMLPQHVEEIKKHKNLTIESRHRVGGDQTVPVEITLNYILYKGRVCHFGYFRNITKRKEYEEELKRSNAELEQFSYAISHDMRQPLRMISSYLQLIEMGLGEQLDSEKRNYFNFAIEGAKRIDQMLVELLEYSRVGRMGEPQSWTESRAILDLALQFLQPVIAEAQAKLTISGDWPRIFASHDEILRMLQNLIGNAVKFRVAGRTPEITINSKAVSNEWHLCIADNGVGIIPDQIKRLFQVFQRLQLRTAYEGNGVGLALCRKIAEHHKGRIWAESAGEGQGSKFCVVLPVLNGKELYKGEITT